MASSSDTTSSKNVIEIEGTNINNNDIKKGTNSTSNNNAINEEHVAIFVGYNGIWEWDGKEWLFKDFKGSVTVVSKHITLSQLTDILKRKLNVLEENSRLKLEVNYKVGSLAFPVIEIEDDLDLSVFISETSKRKIPLCVTLKGEKYKDGHVMLSGITKDDTVESKLIKAIWKGDWVKAREIVITKEVTWTSKLDGEGNTALHFAVGAYYKDNEVVRDIVMGIGNESLETTLNIREETPAHTAISFGNTEALKIMLGFNTKCLFIPDKYDKLPIHYALATSAIKTFLDLFEQMKSCNVEYDKLFRGMRGLSLLHQIIDTGLIDVAYKLINDYPSLATTVYEEKSALDCIIRNPKLFYSGTYYTFYDRFIYHNMPTENNSFGSTDTTDVENQKTPKNDKFVTKYTRRCLHDVISRIYFKLWETTLWHVPRVKHLREDKVKHNTTIKLLRRICEETDRTHASNDIERLYSSPFCLAVENNHPEAVDVLTTYFAGLYHSKKDGHNIYQLIVLNRSEKVYSYILHHKRFAKSGFSSSIDDDGNNIVHLTGRLAPRHKLIAAFSATLQMQQELQWFEEVKKVVGKAHTRALNKNKETPMMVFRREHEKLRNDGEEWIKRSADSYAVTAALIIAIVFAAAITVPGGNDSATGKPIYDMKASLIIFAISDAMSLFTSTASLLMFLSVIIARYADEDFLYGSPSRLFINGVVMLFWSLISMLIAFSAALYITFGQGKIQILVPIAALIFLPLVSVSIHFPLLQEMINSTFGHGIVGKKKDYWQSSDNANKKRRT